MAVNSNGNLREALTFDDVLIQPALSQIMPSDTDLRTRITREIQHDILPQFLAGDRLLGLIGEPRHRRSYLYDISDAIREPAATRVRLFHNNTVRTIAPEYVWAAIVFDVWDDDDWPRT